MSKVSSVAAPSFLLPLPDLSGPLTPLPCATDTAKQETFWGTLGDKIQDHIPQTAPTRVIVSECPPGAKQLGKFVAAGGRRPTRQRGHARTGDTTVDGHDRRQDLGAAGPARRLRFLVTGDGKFECVPSLQSRVRLDLGT